MTRLAILGAGPIGLEAALAAAERGHDFTVFEAADRQPAATSATGVTSGCSRRGRSPSPSGCAPRSSDAAPEGDALPTGDELADRVLDPVAQGSA